MDISAPIWLVGVIDAEICHGRSNEVANFCHLRTQEKILIPKYNKFYISYNAVSNARAQARAPVFADFYHFAARLRSSSKKLHLPKSSISNYKGGQRL